MSKPFGGVVNVDIRDSKPDWAPFEPPKAPDGAPSVVYVVLDDVGFSAIGCYGGPVETPNIDKLAAEGVRYTQWHTTALCSPTRSCQPTTVARIPETMVTTLATPTRTSNGLLTPMARIHRAGTAPREESISSGNSKIVRIPSRKYLSTFRRCDNKYSRRSLNPPWWRSRASKVVIRLTGRTTRLPRATADLLGMRAGPAGLSRTAGV